MARVRQNYEATRGTRPALPFGPGGIFSPFDFRNVEVDFDDDDEDYDEDYDEDDE